MDVRLHDGNRIALIVLDSALEIAFKEYLVNESGEAYSDKRLKEIFEARHKVHEEVRRHNEMTRNFWQKVNFYYNLRCKLVHERASVAIADAEIEDFRSVVELAFKKLFGLKMP